MNKVTLTRQQLYELVWQEPLLTLARKYNISDVGLRKICIGMGIPLPGAGYWSKIKAGHNAAISPLPKGFQGKQETDLSLRVAGEDNIEDGLSPQLALQKIIEMDASLDLNVKTTLINPDPLVFSAQAMLSKRTKYYKDDDMLYSGSQLGIRVTAPHINRALCFMNTLVKIMRQRGHSFIEKNGECFIVLYKEEIEMSLREMQTTIKGTDRWATRTYQPNGILAIEFKYYSNTVTGKDGKVPIEQQLSKIVARLELMGEKLMHERIEQEIRNKERQEKEKIQQSLAERKKLELTSFQKIMRESMRWKKSVVLREYIGQVELSAKSEDDLDEELLAWLNWARKKADWYDPLTETDDEWLKQIDRDKVLEYEQPRQNTAQFSQPSFPKTGWPLLPWYMKNSL